MFLVTTTASISPTSSHVPSTTTIPGVTTSIHVSSTSVGSTVVLLMEESKQIIS
jgi:hypothetical protein